MTNRVITFLDEIGRDFKNGLAKIDPFIKKGIVLAQVALPEIVALNPGLGAIFGTVLGTVATIEQKFAAMQAQSGTGVQKAATALTILEPVVAQVFAAAGKASDTATVTKYIDGVVAFLNGIPAAAPVPTPVPTAPALAQGSVER